MSDRIQIILKEILNGTRKNVDGIVFSVSELLSKDSKGITFLECLLKKKIELDSMNNDIIKNNKDIAYLYCTYKKDLDFFELSEEDLFSMVNGRTYVEYFIVKGKLSSNMLNVISSRVDIIDFLLSNKGFRYLKDINPEIIRKLSVKNSEGTYGIERYVENKKGFKVLITFITDPKVLLELALKYKEFSWLMDVSESVLMANISNNKSFLMYLINDLNIKPKILNKSFSNEFALFLYNNGLYNYLLKEEYYGLEIESGKILLDGLFENGVKPKKAFFVDNEYIFKVLYKNNSLKLVNGLSYEILKKRAKEVLSIVDCDDNESLLGYLLDKGFNPLKGLNKIQDFDIVRIIYEKNRVDLLSWISYNIFLLMPEGNVYYRCVLENFIKECLSFNSLVSKESIDLILNSGFYSDAYDVGSYVNKMDIDLLLTTLLDRLLIVDREFTLNDILTDSVVSNEEIVSLLNYMNINYLKNVDRDNGFEFNLSNRYGIGPLLEDGETLLKELEDLFLNDGKSDKGLISVLVNGYRQSLLINYNFYIEEIKKLILVKKNNYDKFYYLKSDEESCFYLQTGSIYCQDFAFSTVLHETGHALHYYLSNYYIIDNYDNILKKVKRNKKMLDKIGVFSEDFQQLLYMVEMLLEQKYINAFGSYYYDDEKKKEINDFLEKERSLRILKLKELGIYNEEIEYKLNKFFTYEEYMKYLRNLFIDEKKFKVLVNEYEYILAICDILDALYQGKLTDQKLENSYGETVESVVGHGVEYYKNHSGFMEIIANFSVILKSKNSEFGLGLLKSLIGDDLYNIIYEFYSQCLINGVDVSLDASGRTRK